MHRCFIQQIHRQLLQYYNFGWLLLAKLQHVAKVEAHNTLQPQDCSKFVGCSVSQSNCIEDLALCQNTVGFTIRLCGVLFKLAHTFYTFDHHLSLSTNSDHQSTNFLPTPHFQSIHQSQFDQLQIANKSMKTIKVN